MSKNASTEIHPLRSVRELKGWSSYDLAQRAGVAQSTISRIETGKIRPTARTLAKLAKAMENKDLGKLLKPWVEERS